MNPAGAPKRVGLPESGSAPKSTDKIVNIPKTEAPKSTDKVVGLPKIEHIPTAIAKSIYIPDNVEM